MDTNNRTSTPLNDIIKRLETDFATLKAHHDLTDDERAELEHAERVEATYQQKLKDGKYRI